VRTFCGQGGNSLYADVRSFWRENIGFFEIYGISARTREEEELSQCGHLRTRGVNFSRFCADVFYGLYGLFMNGLFYGLLFMASL